MKTKPLDKKMAKKYKGAKIATAQNFQFAFNVEVIKSPEQSHLAKNSSPKALTINKSRFGSSNKNLKELSPSRSREKVSHPPSFDNRQPDPDIMKLT
jgi:hypothetical protein